MFNSMKTNRPGGLAEYKENLIYRFRGAGEGTRTSDLLITNQLLYRLSYTGEIELKYSGNCPRKPRRLCSAPIPSVMGAAHPARHRPRPW